MRHVMEPSNPDVHLLERVLSRENTQRVWKRVRGNKGAPGIDGMTIEEFPEYTRLHWNKTRESLLAGTY
jgi:RNA-directed DNA polymerase